jgi:hypothetical protein
LTIAPALYKLDYDPLKDFAPVAIVAELAFAHSQAPADHSRVVAEDSRVVAEDSRVAAEDSRNIKDGTMSSRPTSQVRALLVFPNLVAAAIRRKQVSSFLERSSIVPVAQYFGPHFVILPDTVVLSDPGNLGKH